MRLMGSATINQLIVADPINSPTGKVIAKDLRGSDLTMKLAEIFK